MCIKVIYYVFKWYLERCIQKKWILKLLHPRIFFNLFSYDIFKAIRIHSPAVVLDANPCIWLVWLSVRVIAIIWNFIDHLETLSGFSNVPTYTTQSFSVLDGSEVFSSAWDSWTSSLTTISVVVSWIGSTSSDIGLGAIVQTWLFLFKLSFGLFYLHLEWTLKSIHIALI